jgi:hypothetical protein
MDHSRAVPCAGQRYVLCAQGIDPKRQFRIVLATVDVGHCSGMDYHFGLKARDGTSNSDWVRNVLFRQIQAKQVFTLQDLL